MGQSRKVSDEQCLAAYAEHGSVWRAGKALGICGQSVHERLVKLGASKPVRIFTETEKETLRRRYRGAADSGKLDALAMEMGRTKPFICRQARSLGLTNKHRPAPWTKGVNWGPNNPHPRGMAGKYHSRDARRRMAESQTERWANMGAKERDAWLKARLEGQKKRDPLATVENRSKASWKAGWREIGGQRSYFRSLWEANYARYLEWRRHRGEILAWQHEPKTFWFEGIRRGVCSYKPDFRVTHNDGRHEWHEVKGWMDDRSRVALKRFAKFYPNEKLILVDSKAYRALARTAGYVIRDWESASSPTGSDASELLAIGRRLR